MITNGDVPKPTSIQCARRGFLGKLLAIGGLGLVLGKLFPRAAGAGVDSRYRNQMPNVKSSFTPHLAYPEVNPLAYVHPLASVIGSVYLGQRVMVSPCASVRGDRRSRQCSTGRRV